jgi:hypothetical protein
MPVQSEKNCFLREIYVIILQILIFAPLTYSITLWNCETEDILGQPMQQTVYVI